MPAILKRITVFLAAAALWGPCVWAGGDPAAVPSESGAEAPAPGMPFVQRRYFEKARSDQFARISRGMLERDVKDIVAGREYQAKEYFRDGFAFALDPQGAGFFSFPGWTPPADRHVDFFVGDASLLVVYYDEEYKVTSANQFPRQEGEVPWANPYAAAK
jgi:hypothetical protein